MNKLFKYCSNFVQNSTPTDVQRVNIGIFGKMNAGKSLLMNHITQHETSIVDNTPGTTADVKVAIMELHELGPVKMFDTPGTDEGGELGDKKRDKTYFTLSQCDLSVVVMHPFEGLSPYDAELIQEAQNLGKRVIFLYNVFDEDDILKVDDAVEAIENELERVIEVKGEKKFLLAPEDSTVMNLSNPDLSGRIQSWLEERYIYPDTRETKAKKKIEPLPPLSGGDNAVVFLNIPMDAETPTGRLLKPQAVAQEHCLRNFYSTLAYRMNLSDARSDDITLVEKEKARFLEKLNGCKEMGCELLVTDSQAMDIVGPWTLDDEGNEIIPITTFSISMANMMSEGNLQKFLDGIKRFDALEKGDKVLIVEACSHNRIQDDIGTVQIPNKIKNWFGEDIEIEFAFGKGYQAIDLNDYELAIHCGGCMLDRQAMNARITEIERTGIPITNYGLLLSYFESKHSLSRVVKPWGYDLDF